MKPMVKEILISVLILLAILLIFGVLLYDYIPLNQVVPTVSEYQVPEDIKAELKEIATEDNSNIVLTYEITDSDLGVYEDTKSYNKGKANPFSSYSDQTETTGGSVTSNNANGSNTSSSATTSSSQNTTEQTTGTNTSSSSQTENTFYEDTRNEIISVYI